MAKKHINPLLKIIVIGTVIFLIYLVSKKIIEMELISKIILPSAPGRISASDDSDYYTDLATSYKTPLAQRIDIMAANLNIPKSDYLIGTMFLESSLQYPKKNSIGALGYIQMLPDPGKTYKTIGGKQWEMSVIESMSETDYLDLMEQYFSDMVKSGKKLNSFLDVYLAVLDPSAVGKPDDYVLPDWIAKANSAYADANGKITKAGLLSVLTDRISKSGLPINIT